MKVDESAVSTPEGSMNRDKYINFDLNTEENDSEYQRYMQSETQNSNNGSSSTQPT